MPSISALQARQILDSRGLPTIECTIWLDTGVAVTTSLPTGTSKGKYEAVELRDGDATKFNGKGVLQAVELLNSTIGPQLVGKDPLNQASLDQELLALDGTPNKAKIGANTLMAASQAILKAGAASLNQPLYYYIQQSFQLTPSLDIPTCIYTMINGGQHGADNLDIQEFELIPASYLDFQASLEMAVTLFERLGQVLVTKGAIHSVGLVGGYAPHLFNNTDAFEIQVETIKASPYTFAQDVFFGVDMAASSLYQGGKYRLKDKSQPFSSTDLLEYYKTMKTLYHAFYFEDPFHEDDIASWKSLTAEFKDTAMIVGDGLLATNQARLTQAIAEGWCNAILVKPNEVGTVSETLAIIKAAKEAGWQVVMSHRGGETNDSFIADFAVGVGAEYDKFGPPNRCELVEKYNRLWQIYTEISALQAAPTVQTADNEGPQIP
jgi:enolase